MPLSKVLYLVPSTGYGGAETFLRHTAKFHHGIEPVYLCFRPGPLVEGLRAQGRRVIVLPVPPRLSRPWTMWQTARFVRRIARAEGASLVHSTMAYGALFGGLACLRGNLRHVWFQHGPVTGWIDRAAGFLPAAAIFVNSEHTRELQRRLSPRRALRAITLGVDAAGPVASSGDRETLRALIGAQRETILVGTVCRPQPQKGLELFVDAIQILRENTGRDIRGVVVGGSAQPGEYEEMIRARAGSGRTPVSFVPASENALGWMHALDVVVSAAVAPEAFGLTLIESLSQGTSVVAPAEGGPLGILNEKENGFFFEARSLTSLVYTLERVLKLSASERAVLAKGGRAAVLERFPAVNCVEQLEAQYAEIIAAA